MIEGNYMYEFNEMAAQSTLRSFITEEKNVEDRIPLPPPVSYFMMLKTVFSATFVL